MAKTLLEDLRDQFQHTFRMLEAEIKRFSSEQWLKGISPFQTPAVQAMHLYDCLDFYFCGKSEYDWGHRFGGGWWELPPEHWPSQAGVLAYSQELEERILAYLASLDQAALSQPAPVEEDPERNQLGALVYALRHTLHHHGQLAVLAVWHTGDGGEWE